ncbi:anthranilate synthase family protein [Streptomyces sp. NPDC090445]|uniref:anthranilate synthase family protein n=1 Tax=Streptomyces sp. NPDC090445 TaxID=3365963 RepID=UPI0038072019
MNDLLSRVLAAADRNTPFALLHRAGAADGTPGAAAVDILTGPVSTPPSLARIPLPEPPAGAGGSADAGPEALVVIPYRQLTERGLACVDDGAPLVAMTVTGRLTLPAAEVRDRLPHEAPAPAGGRFDLDDAAYARTVRRIVRDEIGTGQGANFVLKRTFTAHAPAPYHPRTALAWFRRLLEREHGAYWTFLIHTGTHTFLGASPERHLSLYDGTAVMNPISGTYRYPPDGPTLPGVLDFLADPKEADELSMVVDEELKMMARICPAGGGRITGPRLKEMARLAHTEYFIEGRAEGDVRDILRETMFAPTVTGGPLASACRVIARYEPRGRGYYSGVAALIGRDARGGRTLDSAILIRTADIDATGRMDVSVGATLVRHCDPDSEAAETRAKAAGLLDALGARTTASFAAHPRVRTALARRNAHLGAFWLHPAEPAQPPESPERPALTDSGRGRTALSRPGSRTRVGARPGADPVLAGRTAVVIDAEDAFTAMIGHELGSLGLLVTVRGHDEAHRLDRLDRHDLVVLGPGPGDPAERGDPRMRNLAAAVRTLLRARRPFVAVCLSHQVLSLRLGLHLVRRTSPNQGVQREIDLFGQREHVGFYNTFAAHSAHDRIEPEGVGAVDVCRDPATGEVHALYGPHFASLQFHAESVLTRNGPRILARAAHQALGLRPAPPRRSGGRPAS